MLKRNLNRVAVLPAAETDPYEERRAELRRMPASERIAAIDLDLKELFPNPTTAATFHRKKLLRMHDKARLEAGVVTIDELNRENSFSHLDFTTAKLVFRPRPHRA